MSTFITKKFVKKLKLTMVVMAFLFVLKAETAAFLCRPCSLALEPVAFQDEASLYA